MTIIITIQNRGVSPGNQTFLYAKYLEMRKLFGDEKVHWEEDEE